MMINFNTKKLVFTTGIAQKVDTELFHHGQYNFIIGFMSINGIVYVLV